MNTDIKIMYPVYTTSQATKDPLCSILEDFANWIFCNPERAIALAAGIATTAIVYKVLVSN